MERLMPDAGCLVRSPLVDWILPTYRVVSVCVAFLVVLPTPHAHPFSTSAELTVSRLHSGIHLVISAVLHLLLLLPPSPVLRFNAITPDCSRWCFAFLSVLGLLAPPHVATRFALPNHALPSTGVTGAISFRTLLPRTERRFVRFWMEHSHVGRSLNIGRTVRLQTAILRSGSI